MLDVSRIVSDSRLAQSFTILRSTTAFVVGGVATTPAAIPAYGVILPDPVDVDQAQEGDRITGSIEIYSTQALYETNTEGTSDTVSWHGQTYRLASVEDWSDSGYWMAKGKRISGE